MLEHFYEMQAYIRRLRLGPCGPFMDRFADELHRLGFRQATAYQYLGTMGNFSEWCARRGLRIDEIDENVLDRYERALRRERKSFWKDKHVLGGGRRLLRCLRQIGAIPPKTPVQIPLLVEAFEQWMRHHRNVTDATIATFRPVAIAFVLSAGVRPSEYTARQIRSFILRESCRGSRAYAQRVVTVVRAMLRFMVTQRRWRCSPAMLAAVPTVANWRLSTLPRYTSEKTVERIIATCDARTALGRRDRAILLLLARLGLRSGDVTGLRLGDIDWDRARLRVTGKNRMEAWLPLPQEVGDAILAYLRRGRPACKDDHLFLREVAPQSGLRSSVGCIVARAIQRAGIDVPIRGAHLLRHSRATALLQQGVPLDAISSLLRHRDPATTRLYAKVDMPLLGSVVQPWPTEVPR